MGRRRLNESVPQDVHDPAPRSAGDPGQTPFAGDDTKDGAVPVATTRPPSPAPCSGAQNPPGESACPLSGVVVALVSWRATKRSPGPPRSTTAPRLPFE